MLKKAGILFLCWLFGLTASAQKMLSDSLSLALAKEKTDTGKVQLLFLLSNSYQSYQPDTAMQLAYRALHLAEKINYSSGISKAYSQIAAAYNKAGNYPKALEFYLLNLRLEENGRNKLNLAGALMNIATVYVYQEEYAQALVYYRQADSLIQHEQLNGIRHYSTLNLGDVYLKLGRFDSARSYFTACYRLSDSIRNRDFKGAALLGLGHVAAQEGNTSMAFSCYNTAMPELAAENDEDLMCETALGLARLYRKINQPDSGAYFARMALELAKKDGFQSWYLQSMQWLADYYRQRGDADSALAYQSSVMQLKDSINSKDRIRASQILTMNEQIRQQELAEQRIQAQKERSQQLQLLGIGLFIPIFFMITLFVSRRKVPVRFIRFLGIISLLLLFEYLTLFLHPTVERITHHTPVLEILIFVAIASLLIPLHHRLEHWLIHQLTSHHHNEIRLNTARVRFKKK